MYNELTGVQTAILQKHKELGKRDWTYDEILKTIKANTLFSWGATEPYANTYVLPYCFALFTQSANRRPSLEH